MYMVASLGYIVVKGFIHRLQLQPVNDCGDSVSFHANNIRNNNNHHIVGLDGAKLTHSGFLIVAKFHELLQYIAQILLQFSLVSRINDYVVQATYHEVGNVWPYTIVDD